MYLYNYKGETYILKILNTYYKDSNYFSVNDILYCYNFIQNYKTNYFSIKYKNNTIQFVKILDNIIHDFSVLK